MAHIGAGLSTSKSEIDKQQSRSNVESFSEWKGYEKIAFRITFVYLLLLCIPLNPDWYEYFGKMDWSDINCRDLFVIATGRHFDFVKISTESGRWGIASYTNLAIPLLIAIVVAAIWTYFDRARKEYNTLYYWIRTVARYRVGVGIVAWGFRKLVPGQMVLPTLSILDTPFGDFQAQKLYWQGVGIAPGYEVFLGLAEFAAGFLLLFRKTTALGAALTAVVLGNIVIANHVYDGGVHAHSFYYTIIASILLWYHFPKIWHLIVNERDITPINYYPSFSENWQKYSRLGLKVFVHGVFVIWFFILQVDDYVHAPYRLPDTPGLTGATGHYNVSEFKLNNKLIPYSPLDSVRWHDAVFEKWSTLTFKINKPAIMDQSNGGGYSKKDLEKSWELAGIGGGRRYCYYEADTVKKILYLQNKNEKHRDEKLVLHYNQPSSTRIILSGTNEKKDSIYVVLDKVEKSFPLLNGRREASITSVN